MADATVNVCLKEGGVKKWKEAGRVRVRVRLLFLLKASLQMVLWDTT
jgi:hypothetical protein